MIGRTLKQRYRLESVIGSGGMGIVYRAMDMELHRPVAVKILAAHLTSTPQFIKRFQNEIAHAVRLDHPNIVKVYDVGEEDGVSYYVMQLIDGNDLRREVHAQGSLPLARVMSIAQEIAEALDCAHAQGIIHRDIKPENIICDPHGHAYLVDFGIAHALDATHMTQGTIGTPEYISPEQARGVTVDQYSDQYSLAIVLYELLTGTTPFRVPEQHMWAVVHKQISEPPPDPRQFCATLPEHISKALLQALAKSPLQRFPSCQALALSLQDAAPVAYENNIPRLSDYIPAVTMALPPVTHPTTVNPTYQPTTVLPIRPRANRTFLSNGIIVLILCLLVLMFFIGAQFFPQHPEAILTPPIPAPVSDKIVYISKVTGNYDLYLMNTDGSHQQQLTSTTQDEFYPVFNADKSKIAFVTHESVGNRLFIMDLKDKKVTPLTDGYQFGIISDPVFSPDGTWLAFRSFSPGGTIEGIAICRVNCDGTNFATLAQQTWSEPYYDEYYAPSISSDGTRITYSDGINVIVMQADGAQPNTIASGSGPSFTPDGQSIVYNRWVGSVTGSINIIDSNGGTVTPLIAVSKPYGKPVVSPDGRWIAYRTLTPLTLNLVGIDGQGYKVLASNNNPNGFEPGDDMLPTFMKDSTRMLYWKDQAFTTGIREEIYTVDLTGTETKLADGRL